MAKFNNQKQLESWLADKPILWGVAIAARSALRAIPFLATELLATREKGDEALEFLFLEAFRASSLAWVAASFPDNAASLSMKDLSGFDPAIHLSGSESAGVRKAAFAAAISIEANTPRRASAAADYSINAMSEYVATVTLTEPKTSALDVNTSRFAQQRAIVIIGWNEVSDDASALEGGAEVSQLAQSPLWSSPSIDRPTQAWNALRSDLLSRNHSWEVWTDWYEARLSGDTADEGLEIARVKIPEKVWRKGPRGTNPEIVWLNERYANISSTRVAETAHSAERDDVYRWLLQKPRNVLMVLAIRAALRECRR